VTTIIALLWPLSEGAAQRSKRRASPPAKTRQAPDTALRGHANLLGLFLAKGARVDARDDLGGSALIVASSWQRNDIVKTLLDKGANVNAQDKLGRSALMLAAEKGYAETVQLLLTKGANVDLKDGVSRTALALAAA
jgi:ankyrin repeat protein